MGPLEGGFHNTSWAVNTRGIDQRLCCTDYELRAIAHLTPSEALEMIPPANPLPSPTK
jgi:hypothetical protein